MNSHKNARLAPKGREILVRRLERGERPADVACAMGISLRTVYKWRGRYRDYGSEGLQDRSSRPSQTPGRTPASVEARVVQLRRERRIMERIAEETGVSRATVGRILARHGLNRWRDLEPSEPVVRYERDRPGDLIHIVSVRCASPNGADFDGLVSTIDSGHLGALYGCEAEEAALAG